MIPARALPLASLVLVLLPACLAPDELPAAGVAPIADDTVSVEARPAHLSTGFANLSEKVVQVRFEGAVGAMAAVDWYAVGKSATAHSDDGAGIDFEVVALPPTGSSVPVPDELKDSESPYGKGIRGHQTTGSASGATIVVVFSSKTLPTTGWITVSLDMPAVKTRAFGFTPESGAERRSLRIAVGSAPAVRSAAFLPAPSKGGGSKVALELTEPVPYTVLRNDVFASLDGAPCVAPAGLGDGHAQLWSLQCPASAGQRLVFELTGTAGGLLSLGVGSGAKAAPLEASIDVSSGVAVPIE